MLSPPGYLYPNTACNPLLLRHRSFLSRSPSSSADSLSARHPFSDATDSNRLTSASDLSESFDLTYPSSSAYVSSSKPNLPKISDILSPSLDMSSMNFLTSSLTFVIALSFIAAKNLFSAVYLAETDDLTEFHLSFSENSFSISDSSTANIAPTAACSFRSSMISYESREYPSVTGHSAMRRLYRSILWKTESSADALFSSMDSFINARFVT